MVVYFDDILVYSASEEAYSCYLREVLTVLHSEQFNAATRKCIFFSDQVLFLSYVVSDRGVAVDSAKVEAIRQ